MYIRPVGENARVVPGTVNNNGRVHVVATVSGSGSGVTSTAIIKKETKVNTGGSPASMTADRIREVNPSIIVNGAHAQRIPPEAEEVQPVVSNAMDIDGELCLSRVFHPFWLFY